jgi:hypothetical protein
MNITPKIVDFFICDDVRHEIGGKRTLVGIYGNDLVVPSVPSNLPQLCFVIKLDLANSNIAKMTLTVEMSAGQTIGPLSIVIPKQLKTQKPIMHLAVYPFSIKETGTCQIFASFDGQKKIKIGQIEIKLATPSLSITQ